MLSGLHLPFESTASGPQLLCHWQCGQEAPGAYLRDNGKSASKPIARKELLYDFTPTIMVA